MPTIIALDVSLSMTRALPGASSQDSITFHQLAVQGINQFLNYLAKHSKLEYVSLVSRITERLAVDRAQSIDISNCAGPRNLLV